MNSILTSIIPLFPKWFARPFALPYVAGETTDGAIQAAESVISQGFSVTMDILGEHTKDVNDAKKITEDYCLLYKKIIEKNMDCTVSLKLTHLGLDISEELAQANLNKIIDYQIDRYKTSITGCFLKKGPKIKFLIFSVSSKRAPKNGALLNSLFLQIRIFMF